METVTIKVYRPDKEWIKEKAESEGVTQAEVVAEAIEEYANVEHHHRCPSCDCRFRLEDVDMATVEESGVVSTDVRYFLRGKSQVESFECPDCSERIRPRDAEVQEPVSTEDLSDVDGEADAEESE